MPIDASIYSNMQAPDFLGNIQKGLSMREMLDQKKIRNDELLKQKGVEDAYKSSMVTNADGTTTLDEKKTLSALAKSSPQAFLEAKSKFTAQAKDQQALDLAKRKSDADAIASIAGGITDQASYEMGISKASKMGLDVSNWPKSYDPGLVKRAYMGALSVQEQNANKYKEQEMGFKEREVRAKELEAANKAGGGNSVSTYVPGVGHALTKEDAKALKGSTEMKAKFDRQIGELIDLRKEKGVEYLDRNAVGRGKQLSKDILLTYKNLAKLGVLSKSDEDIINAIIPTDPLGQDFAIGQDPILHKLEKFKGDLDSDYQTTLQTRLRPGQGQGNAKNHSNPYLNLNELPDNDIDEMYSKLGGQ